MNKLIQTVTFCADPEVASYGDGKTRVTFNGAVKKRFKKNENDPDNFFQYVAFGATADFIAKYFKKGQKALITGELNNNNYTKEDGTKVYGNQIMIENIEFFGSKADNNVAASDKAEAKSEPKAETKESAVAEYDEYADF